MRIGILVLMGLMISCNSSKKSASNSKAASMELSGNYKIMSMNGKAVEADGMELVFDTANNSVNASSGCNKLFGNYTLSGNSLSFGPLGATKMYCEGRMEMEKELMQGLAAVTRVSQQEDGTMGLMNDGQLLMRIKKVN